MKVTLVLLLPGAKEQPRQGFQKAVDLDAKLVGPWQVLGFMASDESKWEECATTTAWYFDAVANYNLKRFDIAGRSIRTEIRLNGDRNPRAEFLLGEVLPGKSDLKGAAEVLRKYLQAWPRSDDVELAKSQVTWIDWQVAVAVH